MNAHCRLLSSSLLAFMLFNEFETHKMFAAEQKVQPKPNIVLIFADDLGWKDVGYHGLPSHHTLSHATKEKDGYLNWAKYDRFLSKRFYGFLKQMAETEDPIADGSLLDNTLVLYCSKTSHTHVTHMSHTTTRSSSPAARTWDSSTAFITNLARTE